MKLFNKALFIIGAVSAFAACSTLDQSSPSTFEADEVYTHYDLARVAINGIYEAYVSTTAYRSDYATYYGANTDCEYWTDSGTNEKSAMCKYRILPTNSYINRTNTYDFYPAAFLSIERANHAIKNLRLYGNVEHSSSMAGLLGEALTMRAVFYGDLMNYYGEVPARFEPIKQETIYLPKSDRDVIFKQILSDLEEAASLMKFENHTAITRASKALAIGMYARLALQAAGYSCRPDEGMVNTGCDSTQCNIRKSSDPELQAEVLYPKALKLLDEVIECNKYKLFDNFEDIWHYYCNLHTTIDADGSEIIFGMPFGDNRGQFIYHNGVPNTKLGFGATPRKGVVPTLWFKFPDYDTRRDVTCCFFRWGSTDNVSTDNLKSDYCYFGKYRYDWMKEHPYREKDAEDGAKFTVMRFADILLMAAEMANEIDSLQAAKEYMRPVLQRAYHDEQEVDSYLSNLGDKDAFFQAIKDQRAFEFTGEMLRRQDLIRWGCLKQALDQTKADMLALKNRTGFAEGYRDAAYWRYPDPNDHYKVEFKLVKELETEPSGWTKKSGFFSGFSSKVITYFYVENPDKWMYRPIPASIVISSLGSLINDYGYSQL